MFARAVTFEGVTGARIAELRKEISADELPAEIPATEIVVLYDADAEKSLVIVFFDTEEDYARGDAALSAMPAGDTPGARTSVTKYDVAVRRTR